ncbi:OLC1v1009614C1 [Oldenlandia corymbosa var. corymbosa]|uniref:OLC1v1009614C1 n=1 Tax=Oldenlandia corymbosa var. corymbosa TaxID=529605 RepID=A0AAV1DPD2_OLDCO|nr:OLC1v1009614C1 [Oldenlandia corymbosa var. corymbosa]
MAVPSCTASLRSFECRTDPDFSGRFPRPEIPTSGASRFSCKAGGGSASRGLSVHGLSSSLIYRFPPNFVRQLSTKARRNCSNIGVAQIVAASWSNKELDNTPSPPAVKAVDAAAAASFVAPVAENVTGVEEDVAAVVDSVLGENVQPEDLTDDVGYSSFLTSRGSMAIHAGERLGRGIASDAITTPVFNTSAYFFKKTQELIDFKEKRHVSYEYGRYGNYTTEVLEQKMSALEGAESTLFVASGMCASTCLMWALVPAGGHIVTTTDCYRKTRIFIEKILIPKMGVKATVIDPADVGALEAALSRNDVTLFFTESPTNPFLRCVDIELVSKLCHDKGALVVVDGTFASPINQQALSLGADLVIHSATKYLAGHNDVLAGCISGPTKLVSVVRDMHHILGGTLNPNAAYLIIRGMKTLECRVQQQNRTASRMAEILEAHPKVSRVYYPGLASHPEHELAKKQMTGFGGVVSFEVDGDLHRTIKFVDNLKIPYIAPSFGGVESIVDQPAIMSYWYVFYLFLLAFIFCKIAGFSFYIHCSVATILT